MHVAGGELSAQKRKADELDAAEYQQADAAEGPSRHKQVSLPTRPMSLDPPIVNLIGFATRSLRSQRLRTDGSSVCKHHVMLIISGQRPYDQDLSLLFTIKHLTSSSHDADLHNLSIADTGQAYRRPASQSSENVTCAHSCPRICWSIVTAAAVTSTRTTSQTYP